MYCHNCGTPNVNTALFCTQCGEKILTEHTQSTTEQPITPINQPIPQQPFYRKKWFWQLILWLIMPPVALLMAIYPLLRRKANSRLPSHIDRKEALRKAFTGVKETSGTCRVCGHVWHFNKQDEKEQSLKALKNFGKAALTLGSNIGYGALPDERITDFKRCPKCGSRSVKAEVVRN